MLTLLALIACGDKDPSTDVDPTIATDTADPTGDSADPSDSGDPSVDADADGYTDDVDCNDADASIHPDAPELCDGLDNDCDGIVPGSETDASGDGAMDCDAAASTCSSKGMTWQQTEVDADAGTVSSACNGPDGNCDPYTGDTACTEAAPLLCVRDTGAANPGENGNWVEGDVALTAPIEGCQLETRSSADDVCAAQLGDGFRAATFHDGGGWSLTGAGSWEDSDRHWVAIDDKRANCWDRDEDQDGVYVDDGDCDDGDATVFPGASEVCDGLDNDCDGGIPSNEQDLTGDGFLDCEELSCTGDGMTWAQSSQDADAGTVAVSCTAGEYDCDAYAGDTTCEANLPLLCLLDDGSAAPARESNWAGGRLEISEPINGCQLSSLDVANSVCEQLFGEGYRTAEFHDGGAWSMSAYGDFDTDARMWVDIYDQSAECW